MNSIDKANFCAKHNLHASTVSAHNNAIAEGKNIYYDPISGELTFTSKF